MSDVHVRNSYAGIMAIIACGLLCAACNGEKDNVTPLSEARQKALLDSVIRQEIAKVKEVEKERLQDRMSIEVKEIADSLAAIRHRDQLLLPVSSFGPEEKLTDTVPPTPDLMADKDSSLKTE